MTDYYSILGINETANPDEIKKAYRKLANQHHPDKGGDQAKFKDISVAYDILSNPQKKAEYDHQRQFGQGQHMHFNFDGNNMDFGPFGHVFGQGFANSPFGDIFGRQIRRNRDLNIQCQISLLDSYLGKQLEANYRLPSGKNQNVVINVPAGIGHGETIRYAGLGDDSMPGAPRGNLNVTVIVMPDPVFRRAGDDLYTTIEINPIEAMIGCKKKVKTITGQVLDLDIRPGVEHGTEFASGGNGFPNLNTGQKGKLVSVISIKTPVITDQTIIEKLRQLNAEINNVA